MADADASHVWDHDGEYLRNGCNCAECIRRDKDAPAPQIDVERLANAMEQARWVKWPTRWTTTDFRWIARQLAGTYDSPDSTENLGECEGCGLLGVTCKADWPNGRKCCPDCSHMPGGI